MPLGIGYPEHRRFLESELRVIFRPSKEENGAVSQVLGPADQRFDKGFPNALPLIFRKDAEGGQNLKQESPFPAF